MKRTIVFLLALLLPPISQANPPSTGELLNRLKDHPSPYLAMHGADPVQWQQWGAPALKLAQEQGKPLFLSSGYFACHWCHVMQQESFSDPAIAALLNEHFIPVKLDRELQPALDAYLIDFVERTQGRAGWPLNVFITPEGYPLIGLTYAPPGQFRRLLERLSGVWRNDSEKLTAMARSTARELADKQPQQTPELPRNLQPLLEKLRAQALQVGDRLQGGFGFQTRFPMAPQLAVLLELQAQRPDPELGEFLTLTLEQMSKQGLHDLLAGGFFRYTVDPDWQTPHFEKMLYNQALHVPLYLRAAQVLQKPEFKAVARRTLDFALRELATPDGGFISSLSAVDGQGVEGGAYLWSRAQLEGLLDATELELAGLVWGMRGVPNNPGGYLPVITGSPAEAARQLEMEQAAVEAALERMRAKLMLARAARSLPRDSKPVAAWNGLMLSALAAGARAFGAPYDAAARRLRDFLVQRLWDGKALHRSFGSGGWIGSAALEDYAYVARGLADRAALDGGESEDRELALKLVRTAWERFYNGGWRQAQDQLLPAMPVASALPDAPLPSPAAVLIGLTLELAGEQDAALRQQAVAALRLSYGTVEGQLFSHALSIWTIWSWQSRIGTPIGTVEQ